ncbi:hypothetical protein J1N35_014316 [Gossypium stocksii]|uniref:Uncharacterized protein n=1 Tax=Gossypium stocksii TaxID=47602 RepID=A0A9D3VUG9_9ROSI|nr:hypothetical protein J1N35_014316 [Gossypium stocksii]
MLNINTNLDCIDTIKNLGAKSALLSILAKTASAAAWDEGKWWQRRVSRTGHGLQDYVVIKPTGKDKIIDDSPFSLALKAELNLLGRESLKLNALSKKMQPQCSYIGFLEES